MAEPRQIDLETFAVDGKLGPFQQSIHLNIAPLTVFIGPQGTGKSLISQLLYFFRDAEYLLSQHYFKQQEQFEDSATTTYRVMSSVRSSAADLDSFLIEPVTLKYKEYLGSLQEPSLERSISLTATTSEFSELLKPFDKEVEHWVKRWLADPTTSQLSAKAIFAPAERTFFSHFINFNSNLLADKAFSLATQEFAKILIKAADFQERWQPNTFFKYVEKGTIGLQQAKSVVSKKHSVEFQEISELINEALGIEAIYVEQGAFSRRWQIFPQGSHNPIGIDLASSGQMSTWPLVFLAQAMFDWNPKERPQFLHIEEPEIHLHPTAQLALVKVLAYLVNKGFRLVITTHSLYIVYALNNLILAHQKLGDNEIRNMPKPTIRLAPEKVSAYLFAEGQVQDIMKESEEAKQIDESLLEKFLGDLDVEQNKLLTYKLFWE